ncbi:MAG: cohesin domain-containing protein [Candidatus Dojkabacteria bacterium]|jgi:hypothetical protein
MVILNKMIVKGFTKIVVMLLLLLLMPFSKVSAASPSFSFYPNGGTVVNASQGFIVDIMIDTGGEKIVSAKFTVLFDPREIQLTKVEKNNTLFAQWPEDESTVDNDNGVVMLQGFSQSGSGNEYVTTGGADVFARLHFKALKQADTVLDWEYETNNGVFETVMILDGSPANKNILTSKPSSAVFKIGEGGVQLDPSNVNTGIPLDKYILFTGVALILFGGFMVFTKPRSFNRRKGTVVIYDGEKK